MARRFEIMGKDNCPYCDMAQNLLAIRNEDFIYTKYTDHPKEVVQSIIDTTGHKTFPFIWVCEYENGVASDPVVFIGGFDKLKEYLNKND